MNETPDVEVFTSADTAGEVVRGSQPEVVLAVENPTGSENILQAIRGTQRQSEETLAGVDGNGIEVDKSKNNLGISEHEMHKNVVKSFTLIGAVTALVLTTEALFAKAIVIASVLDAASFMFGAAFVMATGGVLGWAISMTIIGQLVAMSVYGIYRLYKRFSKK